MPTEPKCDVCGTTCGLWLTSDGWRCPRCMWAEVVELRGKVKRLQDEIERRKGNRRDCQQCGKRTPFAGAVYCSEKCAVKGK